MNLLKQANILKRLAPALAGMALTLGACNSEKSDEPAYEPALSVAVHSFSISPNAKVMTNLDSVFFSIDLAHGVIFNADSLPRGTKIDKLVPKITFPSAVTKAEIEMTGGETRTGVVDYKKSPTDSIDFSGNVTLTLATEDGSLSRQYTIKVNVHKMVADSIMWDRSAVAPLPSASPAPRVQGTDPTTCRLRLISLPQAGNAPLSASPSPRSQEALRPLPTGSISWPTTERSIPLPMESTGSRAELP